MNIPINSDSIAYLNGNVYTIDRSQPYAEALIVTPDAKFALVGNNSLHPSTSPNLESHDRRFKRLIHHVQTPRQSRADLPLWPPPPQRHQHGLLEPTPAT